MSDRGGKSRITYCCAEKINVTVLNCFGVYFVYKLNERMESNAYGKVCLSESKTGSKFIHMPLVISSYGGSHAAIYGCFGMSTVWQQRDKIYLLCKRLNSPPFYSVDVLAADALELSTFITGEDNLLNNGLHLCVSVSAGR